jgi:hypothetical protein
VKWSEAASQHRMLTLTDVYVVAEPSLGHRRVLLYITLVVIEGTVFPGLKLVCILNHLLVQSI